MKKAVFTLCFFLTLCTLGWAQLGSDAAGMEQEAPLQEEAEHGYYVAPSLLLTHWQESSGLMMGGKVAWVMNRQFGIGLAGYGLLTNINVGEIPQESNVMLEAGYGGLLLEYTPHPTRHVHFSFPVIMGVGGAAYTNTEPANRTSLSYSYEVYESDTFFVLEPGVQAELNLTNFMKIGLGVSYRFAQGVNLANSTDKDLSAPSASVVFKFGRF